MSEFLDDRKELPNSWQLVNIGEIAEVVGGGTPSTTNPRNFGGDIPWITPADMSSHVGKAIAQGTRSISAEGLAGSGARWLPKGTVLFSSRAPIGYVAIASQPLTTNQGFKSFVPAKGVDSSYLYYWLTSAKPLAEKLASGTTFLEISGAKAALIPFPVAPAAEQSRIVEKLEELLSDLDGGVAELKAAQKKLAQYRQSLLKAAVEGALTADWRKSQAGASVESGAELLARILRERRARWEGRQLAKFKEQGKPPPTDWQAKYLEPAASSANLPALPQGWVWASLEQLSEFITSGSRGWADYYAEQGATFIRSQNINKDRLDLSDIAFVNPPPSSEGARTLVRSGDLLLTITGANVGKAAHVDIDVEEAYVSQHVALIRLLDAGIGVYLHLFLTADAGGRGQLNNEAYGAGKPGLNLQQVGSVAVPLPGEQELDALMEAVSVQFRAAQAQAIAIAHGLKQSAAQRKNILQTAFSGKLVPQDPADEPASVLLERIRTERAAHVSDITRRRRGTRKNK